MLAILICIVQRHVQIVLSEPRTYTSPLYHKCGLLMIACIAWAAFELKRYFLTSNLPTPKAGKAAPRKGLN